MNIHEVYNKAIEQFLHGGCNGTQKRFFIVNEELVEEVKHDNYCSCHWKKLEENNNVCTCSYGQWQEQISKAEFEIVLVDTNCVVSTNYPAEIRKVKIMKKDIGFTFTIHKDDPEDLRRIQYVYDVTVACGNDPLLLPLAKKVKPDVRKLAKKFNLSQDKQKEYQNLDIHDKEAVIAFIGKIMPIK